MIAETFMGKRYFFVAIYIQCANGNLNKKFFGSILPVLKMEN